MKGRTGKAHPFYGHTHSPAVRKKLGEALAHRRKQPGFIRRAFLAQNNRPTKPEGVMMRLIQNAGLPFAYNDRATVVAGLFPDFVATDGSRRVIEVFGDYWHTTRADRPAQTYEGRLKRFAEHGYEAMIIWASEMRNDPEGTERRIVAWSKTNGY